MRPTGMPVQPETTSAIGLRIDADLHQRVFALKRLEPARSARPVPCRSCSRSSGESGWRGGPPGCCGPDVACAGLPRTAAWPRCSGTRSSRPLATCGASAASSWPRISRILPTSSDFFFPAGFQSGQFRLGRGLLLRQARRAAADDRRRSRFSRSRMLDGHGQLLDAAAAVLDGRRNGGMADRHPRARPCRAG